MSKNIDMMTSKKQKMFFNSESCFAFLFHFDLCWVEEYLDGKIDHFNSTDDGKSSEKTHGASNKTDLVFNFYLFVPFNLVKGGRVEEDLDQLQGWVVQFLT